MVTLKVENEITCSKNVTTWSSWAWLSASRACPNFFGAQLALELVCRWVRAIHGSNPDKSRGRADYKGLIEDLVMFYFYFLLFHFRLNWNWITSVNTNILKQLKVKKIIILTPRPNYTLAIEGSKSQVFFIENVTRNNGGSSFAACSPRELGREPEAAAETTREDPKQRPKPESPSKPCSWLWYQEEKSCVAVCTELRCLLQARQGLRRNLWGPFWHRGPLPFSNFLAQTVCVMCVYLCGFLRIWETIAAHTWWSVPVI